jgi:hypothetical protein
MQVKILFGVHHKPKYLPNKSDYTVTNLGELNYFRKFLNKMIIVIGL